VNLVKIKSTQLYSRGQHKVKLGPPEELNSTKTSRKLKSQWEREGFQMRNYVSLRLELYRALRVQIASTSKYY